MGKIRSAHPTKFPPTHISSPAQLFAPDVSISKNHTIMKPLDLGRASRVASLIARSKSHAPRRFLIAPPTKSTGPLMERRADRELPPLPMSSFRRWATTLPIFLAIIVASAAAIFNYEKSSSSVVASTLYSLRTNDQARELLGDEIYFRDRIPWVWGELNQMHGRIDIGYAVKGTKTSGYMRFKSFRNGRVGHVSCILRSQGLD